MRRRRDFTYLAQRVSGKALGSRLRRGCWTALCIALLVVAGSAAHAQENNLDNPHLTVKPEAPKPKSDAVPIAEAGRRNALHNGVTIRVESNLVLVPMTVTDMRNRLVTGLERENFYLYEDNKPQTIRSFSTDDAPVSIGIVFDLSGSMSSKFSRSRRALSEFLRTSNPQDEFFVVGFNDKPNVIVDYTSNVDDVDARMVMMRPQNRTALIDAVYLGLDKLKEAKYDRKALLVISDGGDNRSRYTLGELKRAVRESDVQIYAIGIFDEAAQTEEERLGPYLLTDLCDQSGGRMFRVNDVQELSDIATRISAELRNEYLVGYRPTDLKHDGNWRKLKVRLNPPPGLPPLVVHNRQGYYAPSE